MLLYGYMAFPHDEPADHAYKRHSRVAVHAMGSRLGARSRRPDARHRKLRQYLRRYRIKQSIGRHGNCRDKSLMARLFYSLKSESEPNVAYRLPRRLIGTSAIT